MHPQYAARRKARNDLVVVEAADFLSRCLSLLCYPVWPDHHRRYRVCRYGVRLYCCASRPRAVTNARIAARGVRGAPI